MRFKKIVLPVLAAILLGSRAQAQSVSYTPLFDNSTFSRSIDLSRPVGAIDGAAGTTPSGGATYTIPIKCPLGSGGMTPSISLNYSSQGGDGILGQGWSLSGLSVITKVGNDIYHDQSVSTTSYSTGDNFFALDGERLSLTSGTYGADGAKYRTEAESFVTISSHEKIGVAPKYFNVLSKDGTIMQYGNSDDSRFMTDDGNYIIMWRLNKIIDLNGNYIWFTYDNSDRESRISKIVYTGNENTGLAPYLEINFEYGIRSDKNKVFDEGYSLNTHHLLTKITVKDGVDIFKVYELNYGILWAMSEKSHLKSVVELAGDGTKLNDTRFKLNWGTTPFYQPKISSSNITMPEHLAYTGPGYYYYTYKEILNAADFTGDGINEIVVTETRSKVSSYGISAESAIAVNAYQSAGFGSSAFTKTGITSFTEIHEYGIPLWSGFTKMLLPYDYNGDGRSDLFTYRLNGTDIDKRTIHYATGVGTALSFSANDMSALPATEKTRVRNLNVHGDFDGDRNMDFITIVKDSDDDDAQYLSKLNFPKLGEYDKALCLPASIAYDRGTAKAMANADILFVMDYNGDGKSDIVLYNKISQLMIIVEIVRSAAGIYSANVLHFELVNKDEIYAGDFNGDGKSDLLMVQKVSDRRYLELAYSKGKGGFDKVSIDAYLPVLCSTAGYDLLVGDFDGSGTADFIYINQRCTYSTPNTESDYSTYLSNGYGVFTNSTFASPLSEGDFVDRTVTPLVADVNGDGIDDVVYKATGEDKLKIISHPDVANMRLIKEINDGYNRTTTFSYEPLTKGTGSGEGAFYTQGSGEVYPVNNVRYPLQVATSLAQPDGIGGINLTKYSYENMRVHRTGRGLLGFEKVKSYNVNSGMHTQATYELNRDFYVPYLKSTRTFLESDPSKYSQSTTNYDFTRLSPWYCFVQTNPSGSSEDLLRGRSSSYSNTYDADGNITNTTTTLNGDVTITTETATTYTAVGGSARPNAPSEITVTTTRSGQPSVMDKSILEYDDKGRLVHSYSNPGGIVSAETLHKYWAYDSYGNTTLEKEMSISVPAYVPATRYEYDERGRFVTKKINPLGDYTSYRTHKFWGKPLSATALNGLESSYAYDAWGKLVSETIPLSPSSSYTRTYSDGWDIGARQLYYTLVQDPSAPDVQTWYDELGRAVKTQREHFSGGRTNTLTSYDARGNVSRSTNEHLSTETPLLTEYAYDEWNRVQTETTVAGTTKYDYAFSSGAALTTVRLPDGKIKKTRTDASGKLLESDNGITGIVQFDYDSRGNELYARMKVFSGTGFAFVQKEYDSRGRLLKLKDADAGTTTYKYDGFGRLVEQKDPKGKTTKLSYDKGLGLLIQKELDGIKTNYTYYGKEKGYRLQTETVSSTAYGTVVDDYDFNEAGNTVRHSKNTNGVIMEKEFSYDAFGRLSTTQYPSGLRTRQHYDGNGYLAKITTDFLGGGPGDRVLYRAGEMRGDGRLTKFTRSNGLQTEQTYENGYLSRITDASGVLDLAMGYDFSNGNLWARGDLRAKTQEFFTYDAADRLMSSEADYEDASGTVYTWPAIRLEYDKPSPSWTGSYGQIVSKSDAGAYKYPSFPRNGVATISDPEGLVSHQTQDISYTPFHKTEQITETIGGIPYEERFVYDAAEDRAYSAQWQGGALARERWYMGDYERSRFDGFPEQQVHYISGDAGLCAIVVEEGGAFNYYAAYTDPLGSIVLLTDAAGTPIYRQAYDPWGRERDPETWNYGAAGWGDKPRWLVRGYTGHEMLPEYGLINMNGRMYDPLNGRMLRPDNYVQDPTNTQNYNRFSYCLNNPMKYTDPSGDLVWFLPSISFDKRGKPNIGFTVGTGLPGILSAQGTIGYDFGSKNAYIAVGGSAGFTYASVGWGTKTGFTANMGVGFSTGVPGLSTNITTAGIGWTQNGGAYAHMAGFYFTGGGVDFNPSVSFSMPLVYDYAASDLGGPGDEELVKAVRSSDKAASTANGGAPAMFETYQHATIIPGWTYTATRPTAYGRVAMAQSRIEINTLFRRFTPLGRAIGIAQSVYEMSKDKIDHLKGGKQNQRDSDIKQYPTEFQRWYHRQYKSPGDPNATRSELQELYKEWTRMGQPRAK